MLYGDQAAHSECRLNFGIKPAVCDPRHPESRIAMPELRLIPSHESIEEWAAIRREPVSGPECELNRFINSITNLIGPGASSSLTELWLNELACMECIPGSDGLNWRSVSLSASVTLANRVISSQLSGPCF
jgi:hypothetical protein